MRSRPQEAIATRFVEAPPTMRFHPAADLFPMMSPTELEALAKDIKVNKLADPIVVMREGSELVILDGRNRARACEMVGVAPEVTVWEGDDPIAFVVWRALNRARRLTPSQLVMIAAKAAKLISSTEEAAALFGASRRKVQRALTVLERGTPELIEAVAEGRISVTTAEEAARLIPSHEEQRRIVTKGADAVIARLAALRPSKPHRRQTFLHNGAPAKHVVDGVVRVKSSADPPKTNETRRELVARLSRQGFTVSDIAQQTGLSKNAIHHERRATAPAQPQLERNIYDLQAIAATWESKCEGPLDPRWLKATSAERAQYIAALEACRRASTRLIRRLNKDAKESDHEAPEVEAE